MEDLWNVFLFDEYLYFTRSWTGELRHRARADFRDHACFITQVESSGDVEAPDEGFAVRQVDFLVKALLYNLMVPAPVPRRVCENTSTAASYALTEYGRHGSFPTFRDTTEYRACLNGVIGRFKPPPDHAALLLLVQALSAEIDSQKRAVLLGELRDRTLFFIFTMPGHTGGPLTKDSAVQFVTHDYEGEPCLFAYTDPVYRIEASDGCLGVEARGALGFMKDFPQPASLVINPGGPYTCRLTLKELGELAGSD